MRDHVRPEPRRVSKQAGINLSCITWNTDRYLPLFFILKYELRCLAEVQARTAAADVDVVSAG